MSNEQNDSTIYDFNEAFALQNKNILDLFKSQYTQLASITCENNTLYYNDESCLLGYFRLNQLNTMIWELNPKDFFQIVRLMSRIENNINNEDYYLFTINNLLNKTILNEKEKNIIDDFTNTYLLLMQYENFLSGISNTTLSKYRQIVNNILYLMDPNSLTEGQKLISNKVYRSQEELGGRGNAMVRVLKNPDAPNILPEDEEFPYSKAGFASILLIVYTIINAAIILAIQLLK